jgi:uncharacterized protein (TIGR02145 family)
MKMKITPFPSYILFILVAYLFLPSCAKKNENYGATVGNIPIVRTKAPSDIHEFSSVSGGDVTSDGGSDVTARGVCWATHSNPNLAGNFKSEGKGVGPYTCNISGLTPNTKYYVRAYATNSTGTAYGNELSFTTVPAPLVITSTPDSISLVSAFCAAQVTEGGGSAVIERGFCWKAGGIPTVDDQKSINGSGNGVFKVIIKGLNPGTTYSVRAYAKNSKVLVYGNIVTFTTDVKDLDGNIYNAVNIGSQVWMVENLRVTRYSNGENIPLVSGNSAWKALSSGAYCDYFNNSSYGNTYGHLYNWAVVKDSRKIAPSGWHVPTDEEWTELTDFLDGATLSGGQLKEAGTTHWSSPNTYANNKSGFTALPGGYRYFDGDFVGLGLNASIWSSSQYDNGSAWQRNLKYNVGSTSRNTSVKSYGLSIRCIKD